MKTKMKTILTIIVLSIIFTVSFCFILSEDNTQEIPYIYLDF